MAHRTQAERTARYRATPRGKFARHRENAKRRGVPFLLTYAQWLEVWLESGHWHERGNGPDEYVMHRVGDRGAYKQGNVYIDTNARNLALANSTSVLPGGPRYRHTARTTTVTFPDDDVPF
jgi:hypothetical protein